MLSKSGLGLKKHAAFHLLDVGGFTLLEVLIAIFVLTVGMLALAGLAVSVIQGNNFSKQMTTAATLGQDRLEAKRGMSFDMITTARDPYGSIPGFGGFRREVSVTTASGMKTVTVNTFWGGDLHKVQLKTIVAQ